jgi:signal transduction histidine kinase
VEIDFRTDDLPTALPPSISLCFFRVLQESLRNSVKHSSVRHFEVRFGERPVRFISRSAILAGFNNNAANTSRGLGLISMAERLKS